MENTDQYNKESNAETPVTTHPTDNYKHARVPYGRAALVGSAAGLVMALYLLLVEFIFADGVSSFVKLGKYIFMVPLFYFALRAYKARIPKGKIFKRGIVYGAAMSAAAGLVIMGLAVLFQLLFPEVETSQYLREVDTPEEEIALDWILIFETFVFGMVITFIILQGIKDPREAE